MNSFDEPKAANSSNFYVLVFGLIMLVGLVFLAWVGRPPRSVIVGESLPRIDLQALVNTDRALTSEDLQGKVALIHFWGTWCPPCKREFPEFAELAMEFEGQSELEIVSVSCSSGPEYDLEALATKTAKFLSEYVVNIPTYSDSTAMSRQQIAMLQPNGSFGYPTTLLVGRDGKILEALEGYHPGEMGELRSAITAALKGEVAAK